MIGFSGLTDESVDEEIKNEPFYPSVTVSYLQDCYRVPAEYEVVMVTERLKLAMTWANTQLENFKAEKIAEGFLSLADIPAIKVGGESVNLIHYKHAVCCYAKASLIQEFKTMVQAKGASSRMGESAETEQHEFLFYQYASAAIADLQGKAKITVEAL